MDVNANINRGALLGLLFAALFAASSLALADDVGNQYVVAEISVGSVLVGYDDAHQSIYRAINLGAISPSQRKFRPATRACVSAATSDTVAQVAKYLDGAVRPSEEFASSIARKGVALTADQLKKEAEHQANFINDTLHAAPVTLHASIATRCPSERDNLDDLNIGIVSRVCAPNTTAKCGGPSGANKASERSTRFSKLWEWLQPINAAEPNGWIQVEELGRQSPLKTHVIEAMIWPSLPGRADLLQQFQNLARFSRERNLKLDYTVPALAELRQSDAMRIMDILRSPELSVPRLPVVLPASLAHITIDKDFRAITMTEAMPSILPTITLDDALARARLVECAQFQGNTTLPDIGKCAGYKVDPATLLDCVSGKACHPDFADQSSELVTMLIKDPLALERMASQQDISRILLKNKQLSLGQIEKLGSKCGDDNKNDPTNSTLCLVKQLMPSADQRTLACAQSAVGKGDKKVEIGSCMVNAVKDPKLQQLAECLTANHETANSAALCGIQALNVPAPILNDTACMVDYLKSHDAIVAVRCATKSASAKEALRIADCVNKNSKDIGGALSCAAKGTQAEEATRVAVCIQSNDGDASKAAGCVLRDKIPKPVADAVACIASSDGSAPESAACYVRNNIPQLPGPIGKIATCAASNQGDFTGTAICSIGASSGLNADQQILLQCAATSADPYSYATCVGGRLAMKEYANCQNKHFGQGKCFGENNEVRKFLRHVFNKDIGPSTVVGQVLDVYLNTVKVYVAAFLWEVEKAKEFVGAVEDAGKHADAGRRQLCANVMCVGGIPTLAPKVSFDGKHFNVGTAIRWTF